MTESTMGCSPALCATTSQPSCQCDPDKSLAEVGANTAMVPATDSEKRVASGAVLTGALAVGACAMCCVVPLALPAVAVALGAGVIAWFEAAQAWSTPLALVMVGGSWAWIAWKTWRTGRRPASATLWGMGVATALVLVAAFWLKIEPILLECL